MNKQTQIREFCFQYLFHLQLPIFSDEKDDFQKNHDRKKLEESINDFKATTNTLFDDDANLKAVTRIYGTLDNYSELEEKISEHLQNWKISRLSKVDHTNLLVATYELLFETDTPKKVVINEAIEISKKFGTTESSSFINGVLDSIAKSLDH